METHKYGYGDKPGRKHCPYAILKENLLTLARGNKHLCSYAEIAKDFGWIEDANAEHFIKVRPMSKMMLG